MHWSFPLSTYFPLATYPRPWGPVDGPPCLWSTTSVWMGVYIIIKNLIISRKLCFICTNPFEFWAFYWLARIEIKGHLPHRPRDPYLFSMDNPKTMRYCLHFNGVWCVFWVSKLFSFFCSDFHACFRASTIRFPRSMLLNKSILPKFLSSNILVTFVVLLVLCFILVIEEGFTPFVYEPKSLATSYPPSQDPLEDINNDSLGVSILIS